MGLRNTKWEFENFRALLFFQLYKIYFPENLYSRGNSVLTTFERRIKTELGETSPFCPEKDKPIERNCVLRADEKYIDCVGQVLKAKIETHF